jgi:hypothetical protein
MAPGLSTCPRCGKVRVVVKTYKSRIGGSSIVTTLTACPDPKCQAVVDKQLAKQQKFRDEMHLAAERRAQEAKERRSQTASRKTS